MKEEKADILRKTVIVITIILIFATAGLLMITTQIKTVVLDYYGQISTIKTLAGTVDSFLLQNNIYMGRNTDISPAKDSKLVDGMEIKITSVNELSKLDLNKLQADYSPLSVKIEEVVEEIPYTEETNDNPLVNVGTTNILQEGSNGEKTTTYLVKYTTDKEIARAQIGEAITVEPKNKVIEVGTKVKPVVSRSRTVQTVNSTVVDGGYKQYNIALSSELQQYAYNICKKYGIEYELFLAVMYKESRFNINAVGSNSYGLCQIYATNISSLKNKLGITDIMNPYDNMTAGAYLLSQYFANARKQVSGTAAIEAYALNSYNMGENTYFKLCYSRGVINREYSNSIKNIRNRLIANGGL